MKFTYGKNVFVQIVAFAMTVAGALAALDPSIVAWIQANAGSSKALLALFVLVSAAQALAGNKAHSVNHDGTPQEQPFDPIRFMPPSPGPALFPFDNPPSASSNVPRRDYDWEDVDFDGLKKKANAEDLTEDD